MAHSDVSSLSVPADVVVVVVVPAENLLISRAALSASVHDPLTTRNLGSHIDLHARDRVTFAVDLLTPQGQRMPRSCHGL